MNFGLTANVSASYKMFSVWAARQSIAYSIRVFTGRKLFKNSRELIQTQI